MQRSEVGSVGDGGDARDPRRQQPAGDEFAATRVAR